MSAARIHRARLFAAATVIACAAASVATPQHAGAQTNGLLQVDDELYRQLYRAQVAGLLDDAFLTAQPIAAHVAREYADAIWDSDWPRGGARDGAGRGRFQRDLLAAVQRQVPFLYANGEDLYALEGDGYSVELNPLLDLNYGRARLSARLDRETNVPVWQSTRGVRASGSFSGAVFFEARVEENQRRFAVDPGYDADRKTAPRVGKANFDADRQVLDYLIATGVVGYRSRIFEVRAGRDRNRWGEALGSTYLSDYGTVYDQLQIRTTFGPVQYTNLFSSLATGRVTSNDAVIPKKYAAMHRLTVKLPARVEVSVFESVIFGTDSLGAREGFDVAYLNPVIFLRAVEADRGSGDNVLLGTSASWIPLAGIKVYGSVFLDELRVPEIGNKWWANKWAVQWGAFVLPHSRFDLRFEMTRLRPYLYAHRDPLNAYVHYDDGLGHPAGPNAIDLLVEARARVVPGLEGVARWTRTVRGRDSTGVNFGANPQAPNATRFSDRDVAILQGVRQVDNELDLRLHYELLPRLFADVGIIYAVRDDAIDGLDRVLQAQMGIRWGLTSNRSR